MTHPTHKSRISMTSSFFDEICDACGATDARGMEKLNAHCPVAMTAPDKIWTMNEHWHTDDNLGKSREFGHLNTAYIRADLVAAKDARITDLEAECNRLQARLDAESSTSSSSGSR